MNGIDWGALIAVAGAVALGAIAALYRGARYLIDNDYVVTASGSFKFARRAIPVPKPPAPRVVIVPGNGVPDSLTSDLVVQEARF